MKRVLVIGSGGAGKTTFAKELASRTGLPLIHLDQLFWSPGWVPTPDPEWDRVIGELSAGERWIMDGNYGRTLPGRIAAADTVVFLDLPRIVCTWRILKRQLRYLGRVRPDAAPGCPERLTWEFVSWVWTYRSRRRPEILGRLDAVCTTKRIIILKSQRDVRVFLSGFSPALRVAKSFCGAKSAATLRENCLGTRTRESVSHLCEQGARKVIKCDSWQDSLVRAGWFNEAAAYSTQGTGTDRRGTRGECIRGGDGGCNGGWRCCRRSTSGSQGVTGRCQGEASVD